MSSIFDIFKSLEKSKPAPMPIEYIVACLGNPGKEYELTRHNSGFLFAGYYSRKHGFDIDRARFSGLCGETQISGKRVLFLCPTTYMNNSGEAVSRAAEYYKIPPERVIVFCDDVNLDVGTIRIRRKGSDGGQKGVRSIIEYLNSDAFPRVKIGVGKKPTPEYDLVNWVLGRFSKEDQIALADVFERCEGALELMVKGDIEAAMCKYN